MPRLIIQNLFNAVVEMDTVGGSVLQQVLQQRIDWMHACGGKGRCTSCKMLVIAGMDNLSPLTAHEIRFRNASRLHLTERQACQCRVISGEVVVHIPKKYQLPHQNYSE